MYIENVIETFLVELKKVLKLKFPSLVESQIDTLTFTLAFTEIEKCLLENLQYKTQRKRFQKKIIYAMEAQDESKYIESIYNLLYLVPNSISQISSRLNFFVTNLANNDLKLV